MPYITSTLSTDVNYVLYRKAAGGLPIVAREVTIKGGTGVINKNLLTPNGVVTKVSDEELEILENNPVFKTHKDNGYLKIQRSEKINTEGLEKKDASAQLVESDYTKKGKKAPKVNKK